MRASLRIALILLMVGAGARALRAQQADDGWWTWATPLVTSSDAGRVAVPRPRGESGDTTGARERVPPAGERDARTAPPAGERDARTAPPAGERDARTAPPAREPAPQAGRGRGAQTAPGGRGQGARGQAGGRGNAGVPAFCRTGAGHPVFGWQWCADRGFASYRPQWERERWADAVPRWPRQPREGRVDSGRIGTVLGDVVSRRLRTHATALGASQPLEGRWVRPESGALVFQVRAGDLPIAELSDTTGDGRPNSVIVNRTPRTPR